MHLKSLLRNGTIKQFLSHYFKKFYYYAHFHILINVVTPIVSRSNGYKVALYSAIAFSVTGIVKHEESYSYSLRYSYYLALPIRHSVCRCFAVETLSP